jgi:hypothetical protein
MVLWSKPLSEPRPWEQEEVRRRLKEAGVEEVACAKYPAAGEPLHAYAMVLKADADRYPQLAEITRGVLRDILRWVKALLASLPRGVG